MIRLIAEEFAARPIATLASFFGVIGFVISILSGKEHSLPFPQLQTSKYFIFAVAVGLGAFFGLIHSHFAKANYRFGLVLVPIFTFALSFLLADFLVSEPKNRFYNSEGFVPYASLPQLGKIAFASFWSSLLVYVSVYGISHNKFEFGDMRNYWFRDGQYFKINGMGALKLLALLPVAQIVILVIIPYALTAAWD